MKKSFVSFFLVSFASTGFADVISIRGDFWCPYNCASGTDQLGYMIEVAREIFEKHGHKIEYKELNWSRSLEECRGGEVTAVVGANESDAKDFVRTALPLGVSQNCFFGQESQQWKYQGEKSLSGIVVGVVKDYAYGEPTDSYIKAHGDDPKKVEVISGENVMERNAKKVSEGRVGVLLEDRNVVNFFLATHDQFKLKEIGCLEKVPLFIAFSPKNPKSKSYARLLSDGLKQMRKNGRLKSILEKYHVKDWN